MATQAYGMLTVDASYFKENRLDLPASQFKQGVSFSLSLNKTQGVTGGGFPILGDLKIFKSRGKLPLAEGRRVNDVPLYF